MKNRHLPIAIIGGGPIGLAAAAHLAKRNIPFLLFEAGDSVGHNFLSWGHVRVFSPWRNNIDKAAEELLSETAWMAPDKDGLATGQELLDQYLYPLSQHPLIAPWIHLEAKVISIGRKGLDKMKTAEREDQPFCIQVEEKGAIHSYEAKAVIDSSGTWNQPNPIGSGGIFAEGEEEVKNHLFYGIPHVKGGALDRYKNKNVVVVGAGHSATNVLLDLADVQKEFPDTHINWILRKKDLSAVYGRQEADTLTARGELGIRLKTLVNSGNLHIYTPFHILKLSQDSSGIHIEGDWNGTRETISNIDEIISNTGSRPNLEMLREVRINMDSSLESVLHLADRIDPNIHSCGTVKPHGEKELRHPEKDFYIVGSKSYGRAPTFLMATGYEQVRSVVAYLAGDVEAAARVELTLPQTGGCNAQSSSNSDVRVSACGSTPASKVAEKRAE